MPRERDEDSGQYEEVYTDEAILELLSGTRLSTSEVAERLGCHRTTAHERLTELEGEGKLTASPVGNTIVWEHAPDDPSATPEETQ